MANYRQWYWDGKWHDYPKSKERIEIKIMPDFDLNLPDNYISFDGLDYLKTKVLEYFAIPLELLTDKSEKENNK